MKVSNLRIVAEPRPHLLTSGEILEVNRPELAWADFGTSVPAQRFNQWSHLSDESKNY